MGQSDEPGSYNRRVAGLIEQRRATHHQVLVGLRDLFEKEAAAATDEGTKLAWLHHARRNG